ncbi:MAG TPA: hypothetical protein VFU47_03730, partial [Armatimonadota bacterium]|nr:hypothetical protein [Armatimonadota bacterium]
MKDYLLSTRSAWYSYVFCLPLLVLYQVTAMLANLGSPRAIINGADSILQGLVRTVGLQGWLGSWLVLAVVTGVVLYHTDAAPRKGAPR